MCQFIKREISRLGVEVLVRDRDWVFGIAVSVLKVWSHSWVRQQVNEYFQCNVVTVTSGYGTIQKYDPQVLGVPKM